MSPRRLLRRYGRARAPRQHLDVWWWNNGRWELYAPDVSRQRADRLARQITYELAPRWGLGNVRTQITAHGFSPS